MLIFGLASLNVLQHEIEAASSNFLSEPEQLRLQTLASAVRHKQFIASRWLAKRLLADAFGGQALTWAISAKPGGAPTILSLTDNYLSISHSGDWISAAIADQPVGIDIEQLRPGRDVLALANVVCSPSEVNSLAQLTPRQQTQEFTRNWTLKEAWLKRDERGLDFAAMRGLSASVADTGTANACTWITDQALAVAIVSNALPELEHSRLYPPSYFHTTYWNLPSPD